MLNIDRARVLTVALGAICATAVGIQPFLLADGTAQGLPFAQDWSNTGLITVNDDWSGVPGIIGYRGDNLTALTGADPQTILADGSGTQVDVNANHADPDTFITGGVAEFDGIANPTIALNGSGTADAPHVVLHLDTTGQMNVTVSYNLRDLDGSVDNAVMPVALQYRVGSVGDYVNVPAGFVADATTGPSLAVLVTPVSVTLPAACDDQPLVLVRIITANAAGNDEWVGVDDISVTGTPSGAPTAAMQAFSPCFEVAGSCAPGSPDGEPATEFTFTADASAAAGLDRLEWDFDGDDTVDATTPTPGAPTTATGVTTTYTYGVEGSFRPQVRSVDALSAVSAWDVYDIAGVPLDLDVVAPTLAATMDAFAPCFQVAGACGLGSPDGLATTEFTFTAGATAPAGLDRLEWDFDGDAAVDATTTVPGAPTSVTGVTATHTYGAAGSFLPQVRAVDVTAAESAWDAFAVGGTPVALDTVVPVAVHDIQGSGATSPLAGNAVATTGVVTGIKSNSFFIQAPDAEADADPATSEGILVFTGTPPAGAAIGDEVLVSGTVTEFVPSQDPGSPPLTEIGGSPAVVLLSSGNPLPTPVTLVAADTDPAGPIDQLERYEGMRVAVPSLTVVGPTLGSIDEVNATATSNGVFYGVITGIARPFREPGVALPDPLPPGSPCCVPRFDANPERLRVDSDGQTGAALLDVGAGAVVTGLVGPLDYSFRTYTVLPDPASSPAVSGGPSPRGVAAPLPQEVTIATFNLQRFFDSTDDPALSEPVLTGAAFAGRLVRGAAVVRNFLHSPDIVAVAEVENLQTLQQLAVFISAAAVADGEPDPLYVASLVEGNDIGGIDVGFLVKTLEIAPGVPRVLVEQVTQEGAAAVFVNPNTGATEVLFDRPPLVLEAVVNGTGGSPFPLTAVLNHLRSLNGIDDTTPQGTGTEGARVRAKRAAQAEYVAGFVQSRQGADPAERIVVLGDLNAFEFSDGFVDVTGTIQGAPAPADQVVRATSDLVDPDLSNLTTAVSAGERYTYVFDGSAQALDHVLVSSALVAATSAVRIEHARVGADFPETARNLPGTGLRLSDHDPAVAFLRPSDTGASLYTVAPCRAIDTRLPADQPPLAAGESRPFTLAGRCGVPTTARAVVVNVAVTSPTAAGHLRLHPAGTVVPTTAAINYAAGQTRANNAILGLSAQGEVAVLCNQASGTVHLIVDVSGYFE